MTKRPDEDEIRALRSLLDATPTTYGPSPTAQTEAALLDEFPDVDRFEVAFAVHQGKPLQSLPPGFGIDLHARVRALREAERRLALPRPVFQEILIEVLPRLLAIHLAEPEAIEAAVRRKIATTTAIVSPVIDEERRARTRRATEALQARKKHWAERAAQLRADGLTLEQIALRLSGERRRKTDVRTVSRWLAPRKP